MKINSTLLFLCCLFLVQATFAQTSLDQFRNRIKKRGTYFSLKNKFAHTPVYSGTYTDAPVTERTCETMEAHEELQAKYPDMPSLDEWENAFQREIQSAAIETRGPENVLTIPVVVHVIHNGESIGQGANISQAQIQSQIDVLNEDFRRTGAGSNNHPAGADMEIEFALALVNPQGSALAEPGINRVNGGRAFWERNSIEQSLKPNTQWDPNRYLNMWVLTFGGDSEGLLGYAQFPSFSGLQGFQQNEGLASTDGVVIRYQSFGRVGNVQAPYNQGRTTTHEVGHWLGLRHIWGDGDCNVDDFCNDTPTAEQPNYQCVNNDSCPGEDDDMIENYMDYSPDACMNIFTNDQKARMRTVLERSPRRKELVSSTVTSEDENPDQTGRPVAIFDVDRTTDCAGATITFTDLSENNPTSWTWEFFDPSGALLGTFTDRNIDITFNGAGIYSVKLTVQNAAGNDEVSVDNLIAILSNESYNFYSEDFEDANNLLEDWVLFNPDNDRTFALSDESSFGDGFGSIVFDNYSTDDDPTGTVDILISPEFDLSQVNDPYIYFEHAYAQFSQTYSDTLVWFYTTDCGETINPFWGKGGVELATAAPTENSFVPTSDQWTWTQISLEFLSGQSSVHLLAANFSGWGNNLYFDNFFFFDGALNSDSAPQLSAGTARTTICEGETIQFQDFSSDYPTQWNWTFEGGTPSTSNFQHPFVTYNNPGTFDIGLAAANSFGSNSGTIPDFITVLPLPTINVTSSQNQICGGMPVTLTASGAQTYQWFDERSGTLVFEGPSIEVTLFEERTFLIQGTNAAGCSAITAVTIPVTAPPVPTISLQNDQLVSTAANGYQWYLDGNPISGATGQSITPTQSGFYSVEVFDNNGCASISNPLEVILTSTSNLDDISHNVQVYPNPTSGQIQVRIQNELRGQFDLQVMNSLGQIVESFQLNKNQDQVEVNLELANLPVGIYMLSIQNDKKRATKRIIKQ